MPSELILVLLNPEVTLAGRKRVRSRLAQLKAVFQLEFKDGFVVRMEGAAASQVQVWKEVRLAGGVHYKKKTTRM